MLLLKLGNGTWEMGFLTSDKLGYHHKSHEWGWHLLAGGTIDEEAYGSIVVEADKKKLKTKNQRQIFGL